MGAEQAALQIAREVPTEDRAEPRVEARYDAVVVIQAMLEAFAGEDPRVADLAKSVRELQTAIAAADGERLTPARTASLEGQIDAAERVILGIDAGLSTEDFRRWMDAASPAPAALLAYAELLGGHPNGLSSRLDRFELIATRLLTSDLAHELISREEADPMLQRLAGGITASATTRAAARSFFSDSAKRLESFETVDALLDSGFYLDVRGYKWALGASLRDPDILFVAVDLDVRVSRRLSEFRSDSQCTNIDLDVRLAAERERVESIFEDGDGGRGPAKFELQPPSTRPPVRQSYRPSGSRRSSWLSSVPPESRISSLRPPALDRPSSTAPERRISSAIPDARTSSRPAGRRSSSWTVSRSVPPGRRSSLGTSQTRRSRDPRPRTNSLAPRRTTRRPLSRTIRMVLAALVTASAFVIGLTTMQNARRQNELVPVEAGQLEAISDVLKAGEMSTNGDRRVFLGEVEPAWWERLAPTDRRGTAESIRGRLRILGVDDAVVLGQGVPVVKIERMKVVYVQ